MKKIQNKHLFFSILALFIMLTSPLHPFANGFTDIDSSVYLYIGKSMTYGQFPYIDSFDHKGILVYLIDFLGYSLAGNTGVWLIEFLFLYVSILFCYKTARLFSSKTPSILATIFVFILFGWYLQEGNLVEEYAVPMIFISLYLFTKYFTNGYNISKKNTLITGFCLGFVLFLRPNMIAVWVVFYPIILFNLLYLKKYLKAVNLILFVGLGVLAIILPLLLLIIKNGALDEFIAQYFTFNAQYSLKLGATMTDRLKAFSFYSNNPFFYISIVFFTISILFRKSFSKNQFLYFLGLLLFLIISYISILVSGRMYEHYAMVIAPCYIIPITFSVEFAYNKLLQISNNNKLTITAISIIFGIFLMYPIATELYRIKKTFAQNNEYNELAQVIKNNTTQKDFISVYGNAVSVNLLSDRKSASKFIYQPFALKTFNDNLLIRYKKDLEKNAPKIICAAKYANFIFNKDADKTDERLLFLNNLLSNEYKIIHKTTNFLVYIKK